MTASSLKVNGTATVTGDLLAQSGWARFWNVVSDYVTGQQMVVSEKSLRVYGDMRMYNTAAIGGACDDPYKVALSNDGKGKLLACSGDMKWVAGAETTWEVAPATGYGWVVLDNKYKMCAAPATYDPDTNRYKVKAGVDVCYDWGYKCTETDSDGVCTATETVCTASTPTNTTAYVKCGY